MSEIRLNRAAYIHNINQIAQKIGGVDKILLVLKDNAYGHGVGILAPLARELGIKNVAVKNEREAYEIRQFFDQILILSHIPTGTEDDSFIYAINEIDDFKKLKTGTKVHIAVDTGMRRNGLKIDDLEYGIRLCRELKFELKGVFTHFFASDENGESYDLQCKEFANAKEIAQKVGRECGFYDVMFHCENTAATERESKFEHDFVRVGMAQYGYSQYKNGLNLQRVLSLFANRVSSRTIKKGESTGYGGAFVAPKDMKIATYDLGYGDGLLRYDGTGDLRLGNGEQVLGKMSMDSFCAPNCGGEICVFDDARVWAEFFGTISYEILVKLSPQIKRVFV